MTFPAEKRALALSIAARLRDIPRHRAALLLAMAAFGESFDRAAFAAAAASDDPAELVKAYPVQSGFENLQSHITGLVREGLEVAGAVDPSERANAPRDLRRLQRLGVISHSQCERLIDYQGLRSSVQHAYTEASQLDLRDAAVGLIDEIDTFIADYRRWISTVIDALGRS